MARRRSIRGVLGGLLGSLTSRYSDYEGYWLFGMLVVDLEEMTFDLLGDAEPAGQSGPRTAAIRRARTIFRQQLEKGGLGLSCIREARLDIRRSSTSMDGHQNGHVTTGFEVVFTARAVSDLNGVYVSTTTLFVAPHDPQLEHRSTRG